MSDDVEELVEKWADAVWFNGAYKPDIRAALLEAFRAGQIAAYRDTGFNDIADELERLAGGK
jgi:hypothetical protein